MTREVREELAHHGGARGHDPRGWTHCELCAEAGALCRFAGALHLAGGKGSRSGAFWMIEVSTGAVARRLQHTLVEHLEVRRAMEVRHPSGLRASSWYRLSVSLQSVGSASALGGSASALGLVDAAEMVVRAAGVPKGAAARRGWVRGAAMAGLSLSAPHRTPHLEIAAPTRSWAEGLCTLIAEMGAPGARVGVRHAALGEQRYRVVLKSGEQIGAVLAELGAYQAFLARDLRRMERELRSDANRGANADRANMNRAATAAADQVHALHHALQKLEAQGGLETRGGGEAQAVAKRISGDLLATALTRIANPEATLQEVGDLLDPPVGRATVHRRIKRFVELTSGEISG